MMLWLLLGVLLLPTLFAVLARLIARRGSSRGAVLVAAAGFAGCAACAVVLRAVPLDTAALGPLRAVLASSNVVIANESLVNEQVAGGRLSENESEQRSEAGDLRPSATALAEPTPAPTATLAPTAPPPPPPEPTTQPTALPEEPTPLPGRPLPTAAPTAEPTPAPTTEPTLEPTDEPEPTAAPEPRPQPIRYVVDPGDTLRGIAALYDIDSAVLQRYNGLSDAEADSLRIGQVLYIPPR